MRTKRVLYNFIMKIFLNIILSIIGFILPPLRIKIYGSEINGLLASIQSFLPYLNLVEGGIGAASQQALYKPLAKNDILGINAILSATRGFYYKSGAFFSIILIGFSLIFPLVTNDQVSRPLVTILVFIMAGSSLLDYFIYSKYRILLAADQRGYITGIIQILTLIISNFIAALLMVLGKSILLVMLFSTSANLLKIILTIYYVKSNYPGIGFSSKPNNLAINQRWDALIHQIAALIIFNSPIVIITVYCGLKEVSIYTVYLLVFSAIGGIIGAFSSGLISGFGQILALDDKQVFKKVYGSFECFYYLILTWVYTCTMVLTIPFMKIYTEGMKDANYIDPILTILFVLVGIANNIRVPQNTIVVAAGHFKETRNRAIIEASINITASLIFVQFFDLYGVLLGSICSFTYRTLDFIIYGNKIILSQSPIKTFKRLILNGVWAGLVILFFDEFYIINVSNWVSWIIASTFVSITCFIIILIGNLISDRMAMYDIYIRIKPLLGGFFNLFRRLISFNKKNWSNTKL